MKKGLVFGGISCLLVFILITYSSKIPSEVPGSVVTIGDQTIETALGYHNWFDKDKGGNTHFGDSPQNLVKELHMVIVKKGERVCFDFKTLRLPKRNTVYLIVPNEKEPLNFGMIEQPSEGNSFIVPEESGPYIFVLTGYWDDSHVVDYAFKIAVDKIGYSIYGKYRVNRTSSFDTVSSSFQSFSLELIMKRILY